MEQARILVVEDDSEIRVPMMKYLKQFGLCVDGVGDTGAARAWLRAQPVDLLILDIWLPGGDGLTFGREVLNQKGDRPAVIFLSAPGELADKVTGLELGADDYMTKPFVPRELVSRIHAPY